MESSAASAAPASVRPRRGGRPSLPESERRRHHVSFWVTPAELNLLESRAAAAGSVSAYVRGRALATPGQPKRKPSRRDLGPVVAQLARLGNNLNQVLREARMRNFPATTGDEAEAVLKDLGAYFRRLAAGDDDPET